MLIIGQLFKGEKSSMKNSDLFLRVIGIPLASLIRHFLAVPVDTPRLSGCMLVDDTGTKAPGSFTTTGLEQNT
jgi:hypothetical protein